MFVSDEVQKAVEACGEVFANVAAPCCMASGSNESPDCICGAGSAERVLRAYSTSVQLPAMSAEQRAFCLDEIGRVEGYDREDYEKVSDRDLANAVLCAWLDSARDKGFA